VGVLYVDGEMMLDELKQRITALLPEAPKAPLYILSGEVTHNRLEHDLVLSDAGARESLLKLLDAKKDIRVIILDNISCLFPGIDEDKKRDWEPVNAWLIKMRRRGIAVILIHHSGKGGQQRGTSGREDALDTVIQLARPTNYDPRDGCHFELSFNKARSVKGEAVQPLDVRLEVVNSRQVLTYRPLERSMEDRVRELLGEGVKKLSDIADALGISPSYACKLKARVEKE
jgi:putative DNA primase/helicase